MSVYVVANYDNGDAYFCEVDSVWTKKKKAKKRVEFLLERDGDDCRWDVHEAPLDGGLTGK